MGDMDHNVSIIRKPRILGAWKLLFYTPNDARAL